MWENCFSMTSPTICGHLWHKPSGTSSPMQNAPAVIVDGGDLWDKETSWTHIVAQKAVLTQFGCPLTYYVDNHSIFRYVEKRDNVWRKFEPPEDQAVVQWKEVLKDLRIDVVYALSPAAKGKVERPYQWLQDHLVRTCVREGITCIDQARSNPHCATPTPAMWQSQKVIHWSKPNRP
jgi:hypothetical protein